MASNFSPFFSISHFAFSFFPVFLFPFFPPPFLIVKNFHKYSERPFTSQWFYCGSRDPLSKNRCAKKNQFHKFHSTDLTGTPATAVTRYMESLKRLLLVLWYVLIHLMRQLFWRNRNEGFALIPVRKNACGDEHGCRLLSMTACWSSLLLPDIASLFLRFCLPQSL